MNNKNKQQQQQQYQTQNQQEPKQQEPNQQEPNELLEQLDNPLQDERLLDPFQEKLELVAKANTLHVLMQQMCKEMGLVPHQTQPNQFINAFIEIQTKSLEYKKEIQEKYMSTPSDAKVRKLRVNKN